MEKKESSLNIAVLLLVTVAMATILSGCYTSASVTSKPIVYTHAVGDFTPRDNFGRDEAIKIAVHGYSGKSVTFKIQNVATGRTIFQRTKYIPKDWNGMSINVDRLRPGVYYARAMVQGNRVGNWTFSVQ